MGVLDSLDFSSELARHMAGNLLWAYALLALTTMPPLIPNSALLVTGGVLAAHGQLDLALVLMVVAGSALVGDMVIHRGGRALRGPLLGRFYRSERRRQLLEWAATRIERHGVPFVVACRFLPSGRLLGGVAAGVVGYPARRYLVGAALAEAFWATYSVGLGYLGGRATGNAFYAVAVGLGVSFAIGTLGGVAQYVARRRAERAPHADDGTAATGPLSHATPPPPAVPAPGPAEPCGATALSHTPVPELVTARPEPAGRSEPAAPSEPAARSEPAGPRRPGASRRSPASPCSAFPCATAPAGSVPLSDIASLDSPSRVARGRPGETVLSAVAAVLAIRMPLSHVPAVRRARSPTAWTVDPAPPRECGATPGRLGRRRAGGRLAAPLRRRVTPYSAERSSDRCRR